MYLFLAGIFYCLLLSFKFLTKNTILANEWKKDKGKAQVIQSTYLFFGSLCACMLGTNGIALPSQVQTSINFATHSFHSIIHDRDVGGGGMTWY